MWLGSVGVYGSSYQSVLGRFSGNIAQGIVVAVGGGGGGIRAGIAFWLACNVQLQ